MEKEQSEKQGRGRPVKEKEKLTHSINLKLTESDFEIITEQAGKLGMKVTQYARQMTLKGKMKSRFTIEELDLLRKVAGVANNVNHLAKKANSAGFTRFSLEAVAVLRHIKSLLDDSKEY